MADDIDWAFIGRLEGFSLTGYVPKDKSGAPLGNSGVTIGAGIDLGQMRPDRVDGLEIPKSLKVKLKPFAGIKGAFAARVLAKAPLEITQDEALALMTALRATYLQGLRYRYNEAVAPGMPKFDDLPSAAQTVICSVEYQYGDLGEECPKFWRDVVAQDWAAAIAELENFGDAYPTRRKEEAEYLRAALALA